MSFNVNEFRAQLEGDGARSNLFRVRMPFPGAIRSDPSFASTKMTFMARTAQLPGLSTGQVNLFYFGRDVKLAGNRNFPEWTLTILNDEDFAVRRALEQWQNGMGGNRSNLRNPAFASPSSYTVDAEVDQYAKTGEIIKNYKFVGLFPVDVSPIDLDWSNNDTIEEFSATFAFQYWESVKDGIV